jgi:hypothetical protein
VTANCDPWAEDWRERILAELRAKGFDSTIAFANRYPKDTFRELAAKPNGALSPVQIEKLLREEALRENRIRYFAMTCLVRYLRQRLPDGWGVGDSLKFCRSHAFASWSAAMDEEYRGVVDRVWKSINELDLVEDRWLPDDENDPIIKKIFIETDL